jgi:hypothetical protein
MDHATPTGSSLHVPNPARTALRISALSLATLLLAVWLILG